MRKLREELCRQGTVDTIKIKFNISCAVYTWDILSSSILNSTFEKTGISSFQPDCVLQFMTGDEKINTQAQVENKRLRRALVASILDRAREQRSDLNTLNGFQAVLKIQNDPSELFKNIQYILMRTKTLGSICSDSMFISASVLQEITIFRFNQRVFYNADSLAV